MYGPGWAELAKDMEVRERAKTFKNRDELKEDLNSGRSENNNLMVLPMS